MLEVTLDKIVTSQNKPKTLMDYKIQELLNFVDVCVVFCSLTNLS